MKRTRSLLLLACLALAGCTPGADPLDWKIDGGSPDDVDRWIQAKVPLMPPELGGEFSVCVNNIQARTPGQGMARATTLSQRLDGQTVRQVLLDGYEIASQLLAGKIEAESDALLRLARVADSLTPEQQEKQMKFHRTRLAQYQEKMTGTEKRLAELRAPLIARLPKRPDSK